MVDYKKLAERLRKGTHGSVLDFDDVREAADAIENLLNDIHARKAVAEGLMYLNGELAKANAEKAERIHQLEAEVKQLKEENFWLCKGGNNENLG